MPIKVEQRDERKVAVEEGITLFKTDSLEWKVKEENPEQEYILLKCTALSGFTAGIQHNEVFGMKGYNKRWMNDCAVDFCCYFNAAVAKEPKDSYEDNFIEKNFEQIAKKAVGKEFGGKIKHVKDYVNIHHYYTKLEASKLIKEEEQETTEPVSDDSVPNDIDF